MYVPLENDDTVAAADVVCDLGRVAFVVHEEKVDLLGIGDQELLEAVGEEVPGLYEWSEGFTHHGMSLTDRLVAAVANLTGDQCKNSYVYARTNITHLGHGKVALEPTAHPVIDTLGFPP